MEETRLMDAEKFEAISKSLLDQCEKTMFNKSKEYATEDRLYNFRQPTSMMKVSPAEVCLFYQMKHIASVSKIAKEVTAGKLPSREMLREKCQDIINYTLLFHALVEEEIEKQENKPLQPLEDKLKDPSQSVYPEEAVFSRGM